jgi:CheY-like chemotaxis protein
MKAEPYDLVLMDIQMPVVDGYKATRAIRQWEREQRLVPASIIALTASALGDAARRSLEAGCDAHLTKPVKKASLIETIREFASAQKGAPSRHPTPHIITNGGTL